VKKLPTVGRVRLGNKTEQWLHTGKKQVPNMYFVVPTSSTAMCFKTYVTLLRDVCRGNFCNSSIYNQFPHWEQKIPCLVL